MTENQEYLKEDYFMVEPRKAIHYFWLGFIINTVGFTLMVSNYPHSKILVVIQLLGIMIFLPAAAHLVRFKIENRYLASLFVLYLFWAFVTIARGVSFSNDKNYYLNIVISAYDGIFLYLAPLILLFPRNLIYIKKIFYVVIILSALSLVLSIIYSGQLIASESEFGQQILEGYARFLILPIGFVLLLNAYQSDRNNLFALFVIVITFLLAVIRARRGLMFISINIIVFSFIFYFYAHRGNIFRRYLPLVLIPVLVLFADKVYEENKSDAFKFVSQRIDEDTRSTVLAFYYLDMGVRDWVVGKGINGVYYCPVLDESFSEYRNTIENDYLQIILKGGLVSLVLLLLITIPALIKGLFYSNNKLSKAAGIWILFWLVNMYPTTVTDFSLNYLMVWVCVGICYSPEIRRLPDSSIKEFFQNNETRFFL